MKKWRYLWTALAIASVPALAQPGIGLKTAAFETAAGARHSPAHAAAVLALKTLAAELRLDPHRLSSPARAMARLGGSDSDLPAGFPLAVRNAAALDQATIGWGFAVYDVRPDALQRGESLTDGAQATGQWRFAVLVHGQPVGLVTMVRAAQGWQAVSFGGAGLSRDINRFVIRHAAQADATLRYVRVPQATADFIEIGGPGQTASYVPLAAARASLHLVDAQHYSDAELVPALRNAAALNIAVRH